MNILKWNELIQNPTMDNFNHCQRLNSTHSLATTLEAENKNIMLNSYCLEPGNVFLLKHALTEKEVLEIYKHMNCLNFFPVGSTGNAGNYKETEEVVSQRASIYDYEFSQVLFNRIKNFIPPYFSFANNDFSVNVKSKNVNYNVLGINPYHRFVKYEAQGKLLAHYDGHYEFDEHTQTIMTMLIYLTNNQTGDTIFLEDSQKFTPHHERKLLTIKPEKENIILSIKPKMGDILLFNQHLLHSTKRLHFENKDLILTDLVVSKF